MLSCAFYERETAMETPGKTWHQIKSEERLRFARFVLRRGDLENRRADAIEVLVSALEYWPDNEEATKLLEELRSIQEPSL